MKKLLYIFFLLSFLCIYFRSETNNVSKANEQLPAVSKCSERPGGTFKDGKDGTTKSNRNASSILPAYFWDTKMMTW